MPNFETNLIFEEHGTTGWTETFYDEQDNAEAGSLFTAAEVRKVMGCRNRGVRLKAIRCTEVTGLRRSHVRPYNAANAVGVSLGNADVPGVSVKYRLGFEGHGGRTLEMRGIPDGHVSRADDGEHRLSSDITDKINEYMTFIKANFRGKRLQDAGVVPWVPLAKLASHQTNLGWTVVTHLADAALVLQRGDEIYFRGLNPDRFNYIKGVFSVLDVLSETTFVIGVRYRDPEGTVHLTNAFVRRAVYDYPAITSTNFLKLGTRDTGGPTSRPHGRRKGRRVRQ